MTQILRRCSLFNDALNILVSMYIHERDNWTAFRWNTTELTALLEEVNRKQIHTGFVQRKVTSVRKDFTP